ncbi:STAS domain-containing protein [Streptomyces litchfieldiae]|uniref:STAS domain-containing protein n=1 Tax=Streptomyces litchfieldiae TaxID=3075543 RepID=A0ABU2N017_9ACTN|nr:STAS domain-containing protein [Streptomyces sp. DSM 44938]MDT0346664.1 STAS domain-containing protein [Streptomyces sp. DSM 44938]
MSADVFIVRGPVAREDVPGVCERLRAFVGSSGAREVTVDIGAVGRADAVALEVVTRLRLTARRLDCRLRFVNVGCGLSGLLGWLGLGEVQGEVEEREEARGVQEGVDSGDPAR